MSTYFLISIIVSIVSVLGIHLYLQRRYHYICPKCSTKFKPTYLRSLVAINAANYRKMRCPNCNNCDYMETLRDEKTRLK